MAVDVWVRNPDLCIRECVERHMTQIIWDRGYVVKKRIDPSRFADLYFPQSMDYRCLISGDSNQGALELRRGFTMDNPYCVHPLWEYGEPLDELEETLDKAAPGTLVVITRIPILSTGLGRRFVNTLVDLQEEYPNPVIHLHGTYSWRVMFSSGLKSVDIDPRITARKGKVILPNGKEVTYETAQTQPHWLAAVGFSAADIAIPRQRCMFNIESARWAAQYFNVDHKFQTEHTEPDEFGNAPLNTNNRIQVRNVPAKLGDKFLCDVCSLRDTCKYFRVGSVCSVPDSEGTELARYFKTRDSQTIIDGLGSLLAIQVDRLETGRQQEADDDKISNDVTKLVNSIFDRAVKLAKLVDPALAAAGAARVKVTFNQQNNKAVVAANPAALMAGIVNELESHGISRDEITPEMIKELLGASTQEHPHVVDALGIEAGL